MNEAVLNQRARRFRDGDEESFSALVQALTRTLIATAYRYTGDWEWSRDLTQETWVKVYGRIVTWDPGRPFSAWLHGLHRNVCLDHLRRPWVHREVVTGPDQGPWAATPDRGDPLAELESREFRARVVRAAEELSPGQRAVFIRVDVEERPRDEVARELGMTAGTLRTTLHYARRRVAETLNRPTETT